VLTSPRIAIATAIVTLFGLGCRGRARARSNRDASVRVVSIASTPDASSAPALVFPRETRFELLAPGNAPRAALRYHAGVAREVSARAVVTTRQYVNGYWRDEITLAPVTDGFGVAPGAAGVIHVRGLAAHVDEAGAYPAGVAAENAYLARWRALLEGARADITIDDRGRFLGASLVGTSAATERDAEEELVQRWLALAVPVPEEPVGVGARWRVVIVLRAGGTVLKQDATYTLTTIDEDQWTVDVAIERLGEPQDIFVPGASADDAPVIGELLGLRRVVTGSVVVAPTDPLPVRGSVRAEVTSHARLRVGARIDEEVSEDRASIVIGPSSLPVR
jgi:hypothetical protein